MSYLTHLDCSYCDNKFESNKLWNLCPFCSKPLLARYDLDSLKKSYIKEDLISGESTLWRYKEVLPVEDPRFILSLGEGITPLINATRLGNSIGFENLFIKDEGLNPTTSFKARGLSVAVSRAFELGVNELSIPSAAFISECRALGAEVTLIDGLITDCGKEAAKGIKKYDRFDMSTLKEPYRIEGKKNNGI
jgi:threonine synthase